jgi:parvulin-like peptidyl-prolyl isomerase
MFIDLFLVFALSSFALPAQAQTVAKVGDVEISLKEFTARYEDVKRTTINPPTPEIFLEDLIRFEMGVQEAKKQNLQNDPVVQERIRQELYKGYVEREIGRQVDSIKITEAEMKASYAKRPEIRSSHIFIELKRGSNEEEKKIARNRALEIYKEVKASKRPFEELVKLYSDDSLSKATGGDIGYQNQINNVPALYETIMKMKVGEISTPVESPMGFHIVKVTGRRAFKDADHVAIRAGVLNEKRKAIFDAYFKKVRGRYSVTKNEKLIKSLK